MALIIEKDHSFAFARLFGVRCIYKFAAFYELLTLSGSLIPKEETADSNIVNNLQSSCN